jgi:deoxyribodipyrimidine photo-lyase
MIVTPKAIDRNLLTNSSTGLSERLSRGDLNPKEVLKDINKSLSKEEISSEEKDYLEEIKRQLVFREFANSAIRQQEYRNPPGANGEDSEEFKKLKKGETGIPIVDAAVRQLEETGKPHNRARLLIARYATRSLNIDPEVVAF